MIKLIIFDLWDTLATKGFAINKTFRQHFNINDSEEYLQKYEGAVQLSKWDSKEDMVKNLLKTFDLHLSEDNINFCMDMYNRGIKQAKLFDYSIELIKKLKAEHTLTLISNTTNFEIGIIDKENIRQYFDIVICSHDIGKLKPSKEIFDKVKDKFHAEYSECLFIDDSKKNVEAAKLLGLNTIQYIDLEQLKKELASFSINID